MRSFVDKLIYVDVTKRFTADIRPNHLHSQRIWVLSPPNDKPMSTIFRAMRRSSNLVVIFYWHFKDFQTWIKLSMGSLSSLQRDRFHTRQESMNCVLVKCSPSPNIKLSAMCAIFALQWLPRNFSHWLDLVV